ncbi:peptide ABC transporter substrate-binding protein [Actinomycetospora sp. NBRC 106375]|uniref:peptide ABC transporter substrate-binding protein n=1 Tax=Actinomycetospora sp. NBRC 106375 TaxID=3032207 RepID=UPI0024A14141|nr:ABC transporter substrate-binding protein [Actinomycetospora sp. NBRC 106375]GLZ46759.1 peptide ABC transporter substrate-binding protein [Actinomycetospora sp. NBRC 106375]
MSLRRLVAIVAGMLAVALVATACGGGGGGDDQSAQTLSIEWGEPENPLIPGNTTEQNGGDVIDALFAGLVKYDVNTGQPSNEVADSITTTDNKTFTIKIKPGWTFHDGTPVTAQSFVDSWNWTALGTNAAQAQSFMEKIDGYDEVSTEAPTAQTMRGLRVVDPQTFTVTLKQPFTIFPLTLGYSAYYPLPQKFFTDRAGFEAAPVGNGEFRFESRTPNQNLTLVRNDQYAGSVKPQVQRLEFRVYSELQTSYDDVVSGNLDHVRAIPSAALAGNRWKTDLGAGARQKEGLVTDSLGFPLYDPRFANPVLRKAISMAIDRQTIVNQIFGGVYTPATGYATSAAEGYVPNQCGEACTFNPQRAQQLLAQAGGFQGPLTLTANSDGGHDPYMQAVANSIRQTLGIDARYQPVPSFSEQRRLANSQQFTGLFRNGWQGDYPDIETFLTQLYRTNASSNDYGYSNPAVDAALSQADQAPTVQAADQGYAAAERLVLNDMPNIPLWSRPVIYGNGSRVAEAEHNPLNRQDTTTYRLNPQG